MDSRACQAFPASAPGARVALIAVLLAALCTSGAGFAAETAGRGQGAAPAPVRFTEQLIWGGFRYNWGVQAVDLDGDGFVDLTASDALGGRMKPEPFAGEKPAVPAEITGIRSNLYWFKNDGKGGFERRFIARDVPHGRLERHVIADVNRDGRPDVVSLDNFYGDLMWFENPGPAATGRGDLWMKHFITKGGMLGAEDLTVADFDGDGHIDVASAGWRLGNRYMWFRNPGLSGAGADWTGSYIDGGFPVARSIFAGDINADGRSDLLATSDAASIVLWYENVAAPKGQVEWRRNVIDLPGAPPAGQPVFGKLVDLNRDGRLDILMAFGGWGTSKEGGVAWYENSGVEDGRVQWKKHLITDALPGGFEAVAADLDGDGDLDVVATGETPGQIAWFENPGHPAGLWVKHTLRAEWIHANQVIVADLNHDGRPDIVAVADYGSLELRWWRNDGKP